MGNCCVKACNMQQSANQIIIKLCAGWVFMSKFNLKISFQLKLMNELSFDILYMLFLVTIRWYVWPLGNNNIPSTAPLDWGELLTGFTLLRVQQQITPSRALSREAADHWLGMCLTFNTFHRILECDTWYIFVWEL